jgi:hypothetical protein
MYVVSGLSGRRTVALWILLFFRFSYWQITVYEFSCSFLYTFLGHRPNQKLVLWMKTRVANIEELEKKNEVCRFKSMDVIVEPSMTVRENVTFKTL